MTNYQSLQSYNGSLYGEPRYQGLEYDWEVPDNQIVASPGGTSSVHHHWTKGFYGAGNQSADWYAGQGDRYISGEYGNMYQSGQTATQDQGYYTAAPDYQYWQNEPPPQYSLGGEQYTPALSNVRDGLYTFNTTPKSLKLSSPPSAPSTLYGDGGGVENFDHDFELLDPSDEKKSTPPDQKILSGVKVVEDEVKKTVRLSKISPLLLFLFFILAFTAFDFWSQFTKSFIKQHMHKGEHPSWKHYLLYAIVFTGLFVLIVWMMDVPLVTFE